MKEYERNLKKIILLSKGGCEPVHQEESKLSEADLRFLSAKGFLVLTPGGDNQFWMEVTPSGLSYFSDKADAKEKFVKEHIINFLSGFVSGILVTVLATWLIGALL